MTGDTGFFRRPAVEVSSTHSVVLSRLPKVSASFEWAWFVNNTPDHAQAFEETLGSWLRGLANRSRQFQALAASQASCETQHQVRESHCEEALDPRLLEGMCGSSDLVRCS